MTPTPHVDDPRQPPTGYLEERRLDARMARHTREEARRRWLARLARRLGIT